jgi:hypothetical protein
MVPGCVWPRALRGAWGAAARAAERDTAHTADEASAACLCWCCRCSNTPPTHTHTRPPSPQTPRAQVKDYKADLASLKEQLRAAGAGASEGDAARAELGLGDNYYSTSAGQRERMLAATERLQKTSDRLQVGKQQLAETEVTGVARAGGVGARLLWWAAGAAGVRAHLLCSRTALAARP